MQWSRKKEYTDDQVCWNKEKHGAAVYEFTLEFSTGVSVVTYLIKLHELYTFPSSIQQHFSLDGGRPQV